MLLKKIRSLPYIVLWVILISTAYIIFYFVNEVTMISVRTVRYVIINEMQKHIWKWNLFPLIVDDIFHGNEENICKTYKFELF